MSSVGDECGKGGCTLVWTIENLKHSIVKEVRSETFFVANLDASFSLFLYPRGGNNNEMKCSMISLQSLSFYIDYELCICTTSRERLSVKKAENKNFSRYERYDVVFDGLILDPIPQDTLILHCHIWRSNSARTDTSIHYHQFKRLAVEKHEFVWKVEQFSALMLGAENVFLVNKVEEKGPTLSFKLSLSGTTVDDASLQIVICFKEAEREVRVETFIKCGISLVDHTGTAIKFMSYEERVAIKEKVQVFPHFLTRRQLMMNKMSLLPNDVLSLKCKVTISDGLKKIQQVVYGQSTRDAVNVFDKGLWSFPQIKEDGSSTSLRSDLGHCYESGALSDFELSAGGRTFPVHRLILSARSPVFRAMFENDMLERVATSLDVPDLDSDTLDRMLRYVYTAAVPELRWKDAARLYFAADKYQITALKRRCSVLLRGRLDVANAAEILVLADRHQDGNLKEAVQDFIFYRGRAALSTDEWKVLEAENPKLALETVRHILYEKVLVPPSEVP